MALIFVDGALDRICLHQSNRAQRQGDSVIKYSALKEVQLQAAAAQIENQSRMNLIAQRPEHCRTNKPRLLFAADHLEFDSGLSSNSLHQGAIVARFARRSCRDGAISAHVMPVHPLAKSLEGATWRARSSSNRGAGA